MGESGSAKKAKVLGNTTSDEQPVSLTGLRKEERSGGSLQVRRKQRELRAVGSEIRGERAGCAQRAGCEVYSHIMEAMRVLTIPGSLMEVGGWRGGEESLEMRASGNYETQ